MPDRDERWPAWRPAPAAAVHAEEVDGRLAVVVSGADQVVFLNETATLILSCCDGRRTAEQVITAVARAAALDEDAVAADVRAGLQDLRMAGLLRDAAAASKRGRR